MNGFTLILIILSILSIFFTQVKSQSDVNYTDEQCTEWVSTAKSADLDGSGGLSQDEYYAFLTSIDDPAYISNYFSQYPDFASLPWEQKVIYRTMACNCMRMGQGSACCMGDDIEIMLDPVDEGGFAQVRQGVVQDEYNALLCQQIAFLVSSVDAPPVLEPGSTSPVDDVDGQEKGNSGSTSDEQSSGATAEVGGSSTTTEEEDSNNTTEDEESSATAEAEAVSNELGADASYEEETTSGGLGAGAIVGKNIPFVITIFNLLTALIKHIILKASCSPSLPQFVHVVSLLPMNVNWKKKSDCVSLPAKLQKRTTWLLLMLRITI